MQTVKHQTPLSLVNTLCSLNCSSNSFSNSLGDSKGESWGIEGQIFVRKYFPLLHVSCLRKSWVSIIWEQLVLREEKCYTVGGKLSMGSSFTLDTRQALSCSASEQSSKNSLLVGRKQHHLISLDWAGTMLGTTLQKKDENQLHREVN